MTLEELIKESHQTAVIKGWWDEDRNLGELLALMHSEISEALEEWRSRRDVKEIYYVNLKPYGFPIELADLLIRVGDLCGRIGIPLERAIRAKLEYNKTRPYRHGNKLA